MSPRKSWEKLNLLFWVIVKTESEAQRPPLVAVVWRWFLHPRAGSFHILANDPVAAALVYADLASVC